MDIRHDAPIEEQGQLVRATRQFDGNRNAGKSKYKVEKDERKDKKTASYRHRQRRLIGSLDV